MSAIDTLMPEVATTSRTAIAEAGKYLTFQLGNEDYGLPVLRIREIIKLMDITPVPQVPAHVKGVINLRGKVIPVVDLRQKFGFPPAEYTAQACIIVVDVVADQGRMLMGVVVDAVSEVMMIAATDIEATPEFGDRVQADFISGLAKSKGTVKILLDLDRVLGTDGTRLGGM